MLTLGTIHDLLAKPANGSVSAAEYNLLLAAAQAADVAVPRLTTATAALQATVTAQTEALTTVPKLDPVTQAFPRTALPLLTDADRPALDAEFARWAATAAGIAAIKAAVAAP